MATVPFPKATPPAAKPAPPKRSPTASDSPAKPVPPPPQSTPSSAPDQFDDGATVGSYFLIFQAVPAWLVSMIVHALLLVVMALITMPPQDRQRLTELVMGEREEVEEIEEFELDPPDEIVDVEVEDVEITDVTVEAVTTPEIVGGAVEGLQIANEIDAAPPSISAIDFAEHLAPKADLLTKIGAVGGKGVSGRGMGQRGEMLARYGGTKESESAVAAALKWFAEHQNQDGSWCFDHRNCGTCRFRCRNHGSLNKDLNAATAMALLPFLGAGQTHLEGEYKDRVWMGLNYLVTHQKPTGALNSGGNMYSHGLCAITLCEAYAMTQDPRLAVAAQRSLNFIAYAQDRVGGGWRYRPHEPGDTSAVGWQLMALKSGHMGNLLIDRRTVDGAIRFLDSVQSGGGAYYGYTGPTPAKRPATSAVGLLCRMYTGWERDHPGLKAGVEWISAKGPMKNNMYYNYYATQVMRHYEGQMWDSWNKEMRDWLVESQAKSGHERGSWFFTGDHHGTRAGRLYATSMATMILEVYYRHMPIYAKEASDEDFPL